jgi:hypothetical protein
VAVTNPADTASAGKIFTISPSIHFVIGIYLSLANCGRSFDKSSYGKLCSNSRSSPCFTKSSTSLSSTGVSVSPDHPASPQPAIQELSAKPEKSPSPTREARNDVSMKIHPSILSNSSSLIWQAFSFQERTASSPSFSFAADDLAAEKGDEASSGQALSEKNQTRLKEIHSFLQRDIQDQVRDADLLEEVLESINQDLAVDIKASLEPLSQLDDHFAAVKRALKKQSSQPALEQKRAMAKQFMKNLYAQIQKNKKLLAEL